MSSQQDKPEPKDTEDETLQRLFNAVGSREDIPDTLKQKWAAAIRTELDEVIRRRRIRRFAGFFSIAASMLLVVLFMNQVSNPPEKFIVAQSIKYTGNIQIAQPGQNKHTETLDSIPEESRIRTDANAFIALRYQNAIVRLNEKTEVILTRRNIALLHGEIYIDNSSVNSEKEIESDESRLPGGVIIETPLGVVRDIGTQFRVSYRESELTTTVRQGAVELSTDKQVQRAFATTEVASGLSVTSNNAIKRFTQKKRGGDWDWIHEVSLPFVLEGSTAREFLLWASSETGLDLVFASATVREESDKTVLHGELPTLPIDETIELVMAATQLQFTQNGNTLHVDIR